MTFPYSSTVCHTDTNIKGGVKQNEYVFEILSWVEGLMALVWGLVLKSCFLECNLEKVKPQYKDVGSPFTRGDAIVWREKILDHVWTLDMRTL